MRRLTNDIDIHTHGNAPRRDAVVCFDPVDIIRATGSTGDTAIPEGDGPVSIGIHPWNADSADEAAWCALTHALDNDSRIVAIGEIGLDRLHGPALEIQTAVFERQALLAETHDLPVVIHCVRAFDVVLATHKRLQPKNQWIIHGFRGKAATARQLLGAGIDLSFGLRYNADAYAATPSHRRYFETDTADPSVKNFTDP